MYNIVLVSGVQHSNSIFLYIILHLKKVTIGTSLAVQWLRLHTSTAGGMGSIPVQGTKIPYVSWHSQKKKLQ